MKNVLLVLTIALLAVGCKKEEETAKDNLSITWQISKVYEDGNDVTTTYLIGLDDYRLEFESDGDFIEQYKPLGGVQATVLGTWEFSNGVSSLILMDDNGSRLYDIARLDAEHLNLIDKNNGEDTEIHMVPAP